MKISNSKKELARIVSKNGGWRDGAEFAWFQGKLKGGPCHEVWFGEAGSEPEYVVGSGSFHCYWSMVVDKFSAKKFDNWHQTILSRAEYFHLYPAPDAKPRFRESVIRSIPGPDEQAWTNPPTIEQLAADYSNAKGFADRKQQEADDAKADADARLKALEIAGEALGLLVSPITEKQEPELVITDWRDLLECDIIWFGGDDEQASGEYSVLEVENANYGGNRAIRIDTIGNDYWIDVTDDWKFIRRP